MWAFAFKPGEAAQPLDTERALELVRGQAPRDAFLWLHFSLGNPAAERWLRANLALPHTFFESLNQSVPSTRVEQQGDSLVAVIHDVLFEFTFDPASVSTVYLCVQPSLLVTARPRPLRSIDRLRAEARDGVPFRSPAALLAHLLRDQADVLVEIIRNATTRIDDIEDRMIQRRLAASRTELGNVRRTLVRLQRLLAPEPSALFRLLNRTPEWLSEDDIDDLASAAEEFSTAVGDSAVLVERVKLLQEELGAIASEQTNRTLFLLTLVTVLALPINLTAGLFGMNVGGIPFAGSGHGFAFVVLILVVSTAALGLLATKLRRG